MPKVVMVYALVAFTAASLQSQPVASPVRPESRYAVSGTVVNSVTGEPIRRALVQLSGAVSKQMLTNESGGFEFSGIPEGQAGIMARKPGFFSQSEAAREGVDQKLIEVGPDTKPITITLIPEAVLTGKVLNESGEPLESVPVAVLALRINEGRKRWETLGVARTDEDAQFRVANLTPGRYYVRAGPVVDGRFAGLRAVNRQFGYGTFYYPATNSRDAATAIELQAGERGEAEFVLKKEPLFHITATVNGATGEQGASLQLIDREGDPVPVAMQSAGANVFDFSLPRGQYLLQATDSRLLTNLAEGQAPRQTLTATSEINVASDLDGVQLNLAPAISIPVVVHRESANQHRRSVYFPGWMPLSIELRARDPRVTDQMYRAMRLGRTEDAQIVFQSVPPGRYTVSLNGNNPWYVAQARCGNTDLLTEDLVISEGARMPPIEVELRDDGAMLNGVVEMRKEMRRAAVLIMPQRAAEKPMVAYVRDNGIYWLEALAPGDYEVIAFDRVEPIEYANPEAWSKFEGRAVRVHLQPGQESRIDLPLTRVAQ